MRRNMYKNKGSNPGFWTWNYFAYYTLGKVVHCRGIRISLYASIIKRPLKQQTQIFCIQWYNYCISYYNLKKKI